MPEPALSVPSGMTKIPMEQQSSYRALIVTPGLMALICVATLSRLAGLMFIPYVGAVCTRAVLFTGTGWLADVRGNRSGLLVSPVAGVLLDRVGPTIALRIDMIASATFIGAISIVGWLD